MHNIIWGALSDIEEIINVAFKEDDEWEIEGYYEENMEDNGKENCISIEEF